jgi:DNA-binding NtrC family response regulator
MNIVLLNEDKRVREEMTKQLTAGGHKTTLASSSDGFIAAVTEGNIDAFVIDLKSWYRGSAIYTYFDIPQKMDGIKAIFYNTPEGFSSIEGREATPSDVIIEQDTTAEQILASL